MYWQRGTLTVEQALLLFKHLPLDVSFADEDDILRFWSGKESYKTCDARYIGRDVRDCHSEKSLDVLETILREFKAGTKSLAEGWSTNKAGRTTYSRYIALRDSAGTYKGIIEVIQDISEIKNVEGRRRLPGW